MSGAQFRFPDHVFVCRAGDRHVFLDLRRDEYSCLPRCDTIGFAALIEGWPAGGKSGDSLTPVAENESDAVLNELLGSGLLARNGRGRRRARPSLFAEPLRALSGGDGAVGREAAIRPVDIGRFLRASISAAFGLRWRRLEAVVQRVGRRRTKGGGQGAEIDFREVEGLVRRFRAMRPWFPGGFRCLFDSLALLDFLAFHGVYPSWVFGVCTEPFHAHCWVQAGDLLLNDSLEHVRPFTPIMAV